MGILVETAVVEMVEAAGMATERTDSERLDWLNANDSRLQDIYWHIQNEGGDLRSAIDYVIDKLEKTNG